MVSGVQGTLHVQHTAGKTTRGGADRPTARRRLIDQEDLGEKTDKWLRGISTLKVREGGDSQEDD